MVRLLFLLAASAAIPALAQMQSGTQHPGILITCDTTFDAPGRYVLTEDLSCEGLPWDDGSLLVTANDVEIDLQGHYLGFNYGGLMVGSWTSGVSGFRLRNGEIGTGPDGVPVNLFNVSNSKLEDLRISAYKGCGLGIWGGGYNTFRNISAGGLYGGMVMSNSRSNSVTQSSFSCGMLHQSFSAWGSDDLVFSGNNACSGVAFDGRWMKIEDSMFQELLSVSGSNNQISNNNIGGGVPYVDLEWGMSVTGYDNMIQGNTIAATWKGLLIDGAGNMVRSNTGPSARDASGYCTYNHWKDNTFATVDPGCIR